MYFDYIDSRRIWLHGEIINPASPGKFDTTNRGSNNTPSKDSFNQFDDPRAKKANRSLPGRIEKPILPKEGIILAVPMFGHVNQQTML